MIPQQMEMSPTPLAIHLLTGGPGQVMPPLSASVGNNDTYCIGFG